MVASTLSISRLSSTGEDLDSRTERMVAELITLRDRLPTQLELASDPDAVIIGNLYRRACTSMVDSMRYYLDAGRRLIAKKAEVGIGNWMAWLERNRQALGMNVVGTPQRLMRAAIKFGVNANCGETEARQALRYIHGNTLRGTLGTGDNEWFTPAKYINAVLAVMGGIDVDPATHPIAQETVKATHPYFRSSGGRGGLDWPWPGRVWLNPPYARDEIRPFVDKLLAEIRCGNTTTAIMLTHNYSDTDWFHAATSMVDALCFTSGRISFYNDRGEVCNPTQGQVFFYYGRDIEAFQRVFRDIGFVALPWSIFA
jgi:hypothetical protein